MVPPQALTAVVKARTQKGKKFLNFILRKFTRYENIRAARIRRNVMIEAVIVADLASGPLVQQALPSNAILRGRVRVGTKARLMVRLLKFSNVDLWIKNSGWNVSILHTKTRLRVIQSVFVFYSISLAKGSCAKHAHCYLERIERNTDKYIFIFSFIRQVTNQLCNKSQLFPVGLHVPMMTSIR